MKKFKKCFLVTSLLALAMVGSAFVGCQGDGGNQSASSSSSSSSVELSYVKFVQPNVSVDLLGKQQLQVEKSNVEEDLSYVSSNPEIVSVSATGEITGLQLGNATITVTCDEYSDTCTVTVTEGGLLPTLTLNYESGVQLFVGDSIVFQPTFTYGTTVIEANVTYETQNATVVSFNGNVLTANAEGSATVTVTATWSGYTETKTVTVNVTPNIFCTLDQLEVNIWASQPTGTDYETTATVSASVLKENQELTNPTVVWSSTDPTIATVDNGVITAVQAGTARIDATYTENGTDYVGSVTVNVQLPIVEGDALKYDLSNVGEVLALDLTNYGFTAESVTGLYDVTNDETEIPYTKAGSAITFDKSNFGLGSYVLFVKTPTVGVTVETLVWQSLLVSEDFEDGNKFTVSTASSSNVTSANVVDLPTSVGTGKALQFNGTGESTILSLNLGASITAGTTVTFKIYMDTSAIAPEYLQGSSAAMAAGGWWFHGEGQGKDGSYKGRGYYLYKNGVAQTIYFADFRPLKANVWTTISIVFTENQSAFTLALKGLDGQYGQVIKSGAPADTVKDLVFYMDDVVVSQELTDTLSFDFGETEGSAEAMTIIHKTQIGALPELPECDERGYGYVWSVDGEEITKDTFWKWNENKTAVLTKVDSALKASEDFENGNKFTVTSDSGIKTVEVVELPASIGTGKALKYTNETSSGTAILNLDLGTSITAGTSVTFKIYMDTSAVASEWIQGGYASVATGFWWFHGEGQGKDGTYQGRGYYLYKNGVAQTIYFGEFRSLKANAWREISLVYTGSESQFILALKHLQEQVLKSNAPAEELAKIVFYIDDVVVRQEFTDTLTFEFGAETGSADAMTITQKTQIGTLPTVPTCSEAGYKYVWTIDGEEITANTFWKWNGNKTAVLTKKAA